MAKTKDKMDESSYASTLASVRAIDPSSRGLGGDAKTKAVNMYRKEQKYEVVRKLTGRAWGVLYDLMHDPEDYKKKKRGPAPGGVRG